MSRRRNVRIAAVAVGIAVSSMLLFPAPARADMKCTTVTYTVDNGLLGDLFDLFGLGPETYTVTTCTDAA
jgi:ABC-type tungstate transport system permease subunit